MKTIRFILAAALAMACMAAQASPVRYNFTSNLAPVGSNTGSNFAGFVEFDSALLVANASIATSSFSSWGFTWGTDFSYGPGVSFFDPNFSTFKLDASLNVEDANLCFSPTGICQSGDHPVALVATTLAAATSEPLIQHVGDGQWSGPQVTSDVPEPESLALVGVALLGLALARRRRG